MALKRGDVVLINMPFASGTGGKVRPVLVIQSDHNNTRLVNTIVAGITSNTSRTGHEPTQLLIDISTPEGVQSGLHQSSAITCENVATIEQSKILHTLGRLPTTLMQKVDGCVKAALELP